MFNLLIAAATETIIGTVAIIVIVISLGLIVATAVRNVMLQKKYGVNNVYQEPPKFSEEGENAEENDEAVVTDGIVKNAEMTESEQAVNAEQDGEQEKEW